MNRILIASAVTLMCSVSMSASAQQGDGTRVPIASNVFKPDRINPTPELIQQLKTSPGFSVSVFASGLRKCTHSCSSAKR